MTNIQQLIDQITSQDTKTRDAARSALVALGSEAVEPLIAALDTPSDWQRKGVITLFQQIKDKRVIPPLLNCLKDKDALVRGFAALALAEQQEQSALPLIQQLVVEESEPFPRSYLLNAVDKLGERGWVIAYTARILTEDTFTNTDRQATVQLVVRLNDPATADLLLDVFKKREPGVSDHALQGLRAFNDQRPVDILIAQLQDENPHRRAAAIVELGRFGDKRAIEPIKALLGDKAIAWQGDHPGEPSTTVGQAARDTLKKLGTEPEPPSEPKKRGWKLW